MPDFASIYALANKPTVQLEQPMDAQARAMQLQNLANQNQMGQIQTQQAQQQFDDANRVRQTIAKAVQDAKDQGGDPMEHISSALGQDGSQTAMQYMQHIKQMQQGALDLDSSKIKNMQSHLTMVGNSLGATQTPQQAMQALTTHAQKGDIPPAQFQELMGSLQQASSDPSAFATWKGTQAAKLGASQELIKAITPAVHVNGGFVTTTNPTTGEVVDTQRIKGFSDAPHPGIGPDGKPGFFQLDAEGKVPQGWKPMPNQTQMMMGGGGLSPEALQMLVDKYKATGQIDGDVGRNQVLRAKIVNAAAAQGPVDLAGAKAGYGADKASLQKIQTNRDQLVAFENTALKNLDVFQKAAQKVIDSGSPMLNQPLRAFANAAAGSPEQAAYNAALQTVIPEFAKINSGSLSGVLSDSARHEVAQIMPQSATLGQILAVANVLKQDAHNRRTSADDMLAEIKGRAKGGTATTQPGTTQPAKGAASVDDLLAALGHK